MALKDIEQDLQKEDSEAAKRKHKKTVYDVWQSKEESNSKKPSTWMRIKDEMATTRAKAIIIGAIVVLICTILIIASIIYVKYQKGFFSEERVVLSMEAPSTIDSNVITNVVFNYSNDNRANLNDAHIKVDFGNHFVPEDEQQNFKQVSSNRGVITIGQIKGRGSGSFSLAGHFIGSVNAVDDISGTLRYTPERTNVQYETEARAATKITSSPIDVDVEGPSEIISGNLVNVSIIVKNKSNDSVSDIKVQLTPPSTFVMHNSSPASVNNEPTWLFDSVEPHGEQRVNVQGILTAPEDTVQTFQVKVSSTEGAEGEYVLYSQARYTPSMKGSPVIMKQEIVSIEDNVVYAGDRLQYEVTYTNNSNISLRDVIATLQFDTKVLDFENLQLYNGGNYDAQNKRIVWKASDVPNLKVFKPKDTIKMTFALPVMQKLPVESKDDYNFNVTTIAKIDSNDIPSALRENKVILSNALTMPVGAKVILDNNIKYKDGQLPLQVGQKTVYTVNLTIHNVNNDLSKTVVKMGLPTYVSFEDGKDGVQYNKRTNEVVWDIGDIVHGAGITSDAIKTSFEVSIVPSVDQIEEAPVVIKEQVLTAFDEFVKINIVEHGRELSTRNASPNNQEGVVIP